MLLSILWKQKIDVKDRNNFLDIKDLNTLIASFYNIKALEYCGRLTI